MELYDYFENTKGTGVLATADAEGHVDAASCAPTPAKDGTVAFIMANASATTMSLPTPRQPTFRRRLDRKGIRLI